MDKRRVKQFPTGVRPHGVGIEIWFIWPAGSKTKVYELLDWNSTPASLEKAGRLRKEIVEKIKHGAFSYVEYFPNSPRAFSQQQGTFHYFAQRWLDCPENDWKEQTRYKFKGILQRIWMPRLHSRLMHLITKADLLDTLSQAISEFEHEHGRPPSQSIYNDWLTCCRGPFRQAEDACAIKRVNNPAAELKNKIRRKTEADPFTEEERDAIIGDIYRHDGPVWGAWFELGFYTGMRYPSEPAALTWQSVNLRGTDASPYGEIRITQIRSKHARGGIQQTTKTGVARTVKLNSQARHAIMQARQHTGFQDGWVFAQKNGGPVITGDPQRAMWRASLKRLGIRYRDPYNMRHTYASWALMKGNNPAFMARQLGHSIKEFFDTYAKWIDMTDDRSQMDIMERAINQSGAIMGQKDDEAI